MQIEVYGEVSLFVRDQNTGRLVFNSKAIEALALAPRKWRSAVTSWIPRSPTPANSAAA